MSVVHVSKLMKNQKNNERVYKVDWCSVLAQGGFTMSALEFFIDDQTIMCGLASQYSNMHVSKNYT